MPHLRRALFYFFSAVYCVVCPLIVLYALGYIFEPGAGKGLEKTGLIHLATLPVGATIRLENKRFTEKTPASITGLLPGNYQVEIFLKDYRTWTRTIRVGAEKAAHFEKILLLPDSWEKELLSAEEFTDLIAAGDDRFLFLAKGPVYRDLFLYDLKKKNFSSVAAEDSPFDRGPSLQLADAVGLLTGKSRRAAQTFPVYGNSHVLFRDGSKVLIMEADPDFGAEPRLEECFEVKKGSSVYYREKSGQLYFIEKYTGHFCVVRLLPKNEVPLFTPEKAGA